MSAEGMSKLSAHSEAPSLTREQTDAHAQAILSSLNSAIKHCVRIQLPRSRQRVRVLVEVTTHRARRAHDQLTRLTGSSDDGVRDS